MKNIISLVEGEQPVIKENDSWIFVDSMENIADTDDASSLIVPFSEWDKSEDKIYLKCPKAFWLDNDVEVHLIEPWLKHIDLVALNFPKFVDGRAYSQAVELRTRLGWQGELRAVGDVLRDQLSHMFRCGFNSFAVREDKDIHDAVKGLTGISTLYSGSVVEPMPLFRRRN